MTELDMVQKINQLLAAGFELETEQLVPSARLKEDLQLDSLDAVDMLVYLEDTFQIKVAGERLAEIRTLSDVYGLVREVLQSAQNNSEMSGNI